MNFTPNGSIWIYKNVDIDSGEQLLFSSLAQQNAYFTAKLDRTISNVQVVKKTGRIRLDTDTSTLISNKCNYIAFNNSAFGQTKKIYAKILDIEYINNDCCEISYNIDFWQSFMFDVDYSECFIEREHLSQADATKAATNPYDPSILEFSTLEEIAVSKDMEMPIYQENYDFKKLGPMVEALFPNTNWRLGVLIKMSNIDWSKLDGEKQTSPGAYVNYVSYPFVQYLLNILNQTYGFVCLPKQMNDHFLDYYPSNVWPAGGTIRVGAGWSNLAPFENTMYTPPICYIYDAYGASFFGNNHSLMPEFFDIMTSLSFVEGSGVTESSIIDLSIIPNDLIMLAGNSTAAYTPLRVDIPKKSTNTTSLKLMRYPFSYIRIIAPNGDIKELRYEDFYNLQENVIRQGETSSKASFFVSMDLSDKPTLIVAPELYKISGLSQESNMSVNLNTNVLESVCYNQFPTLPYNIDAFTAAVAAAANDSIASRTLETQYAIEMEQYANTSDVGKFNKMANAVKGGLGDITSGASLGSNLGEAGAIYGGFAGAVNGTMGVGYTYDMMKLEEGATLAKARLLNEGENAFRDLSASEIALQLAFTKPAYAADHYYRSDGNGMMNFNYTSFSDIAFLQVQLSTPVLQILDNYFTLFGYRSGRCGIPRAINYTKGISTTTDVPEWITMGSKEITYVKTLDAKPKHSLVIVQDAIKAMFDAGIRFIKGDTL
ncbi:MAG: hypothetical protein J6S67_12255 [Methanobrevibacter sp.]|nr:hypothetical protein [Methanobrevibacter sp.]